MKATSQHIKIIEVTIIMDQAEALWLKNVMQNHEKEFAEDETKEDSRMKDMLWNILEREGIR